MRTTSYFSDDKDENGEDLDLGESFEDDEADRAWQFGDDEEYAPKFYYNLGRKIKERRVALGINQIDMARKVGISASYVSHIESGNRTPDLLIIAKMSSVLNMSLDELVFGTVNKEKAPFYSILTTAESKGKEAFDKFLSASRVLAENADKL